MHERRRADEPHPRAGPLAVITLDPGGIITMWNAGAEAICGWTAADAVGQHGAIIFTDDDRAAGVPEHEMATAARDGEALDERWHLRDDGTTFWGSGVMSALRGRGGELVGFAKAFRDLSERHDTLAALAETNERYRALFESMGEGFALCEVIPDPGSESGAGSGGRAVDARVLEVNPACEQTLGLTREQLVGRTAREILPDVDEGFAEAYGRVVADNAPARLEAWVDGIGRWLSVHAFPAGGARFGIVVSDVTERKRAEAEAREADERLALALRAAGAGVWEWDFRSEVQRWSHGQFELFGVPSAPDGKTPRGWATTVLPDDEARIGAALRSHVDRRETDWSQEYRSDHPERGIRWLATRGTISYDAEGAPLRIVGITTDVTERKRAEQALQASAGRAVFRAELSDALRPLSDPAEIKAAATRLLGEHLGASRVLYGEVDDEAFVVVDRGYIDGSPSPTGRFRMERFNPALARTHEAGEVIVTPDVAASAEISESDRAAYEAAGVAAQVAVPLVKGGRLAAVLAVHQTAPRAWTAEEVALVEEVAERMWAAIEQRRAEAAIRESEARFRALTSATSDAVYRMSSDWAEMRQLAGGEFLSDTDGPRRDWRQAYIHPDDRPAVDAAIAEAARTRGVFELEHRVFRADGTLGWTFSRAVPLLDERGDVVEWFGAASDVTERRQAEAEVRALNETLEGRVAERTAEVRRLAARLTVAEQEERQRIAHVLHDDLQQQLYGLSAVLSLLAGDPSGEGASALALRAVRIADEATELARSLATELAPIILQSDRLYDVLEWTARAEQARYGLDVEIELRGDVAVSDPALRILLHQLLREVFFNVAKHSGQTRARLVAYADGPFTVVRVEDDGVGFDTEAAQGERPGGFGLPSVHERLTLVGGRFEIESAPGQGTRVTLLVPSG